MKSVGYASITNNKNIILRRGGGEKNSVWKIWVNSSSLKFIYIKLRIYMDNDRRKYAQNPLNFSQWTSKGLEKKEKKYIYTYQ